MVHLWHGGVWTEKFGQSRHRSFDDNQWNEEVFYNVKDEVKKEDKVKADLNGLFRDAEN